VLKVIVKIPIVGVNPAVENTVVSPVSKVDVKADNEVEPRLRLKSLNVVPSDVISNERDVISPETSPAPDNSAAVIRYWDFIPP